MKLSIPGLSTLLLRGPRSLSATHCRPGVEPPHTCSPSSPTQAPVKGPPCNEVDLLILVNRRGAQHALVVRPSLPFGRILLTGFEFSPRARAGPRAAAVEDEGFGLSGVLVRLSTLPYSSQILTTRPVTASLHPRPDSRARSPPTSSCCACRQSE